MELADLYSNVIRLMFWVIFGGILLTGFVIILSLLLNYFVGKIKDVGELAEFIKWKYTIKGKK